MSKIKNVVIDDMNGGTSTNWHKAPVIDMFIITNKDFECPEKLDDRCSIVSQYELQGFYPVTDYDIDTFNPLPFSQSMGETCKQMWAIENLSTSSPSIVGFSQYGRMWPFMQDLDIITDYIKSENDIILPCKYDCGCSVKSQYAACHPAELIEKAERIVKGKWPEMSQAWDEVMNDHWLYPHNMYIAYDSVLRAYFKWLEDVYGLLNMEYHWTCDNDVEDTRMRLAWHDYDSRAHAFLAERISNVYWRWKGLNIIESNVPMSRTQN